METIYVNICQGNLRRSMQAGPNKRFVERQSNLIYAFGPTIKHIQWTSYAFASRRKDGFLGIECTYTHIYEK